MKHRFKDCCQTCWFNQRNGGKAGHPSDESEEPAYCSLRNLAVREPESTYCANHPLRFPRKLPLPVGPVYRSDRWGVRRVWRTSPDNQAVRDLLLDLLSKMRDKPRPEYPFGIPFDEVVIWQLGQFQEKRAASDLMRILQFDPEASDEVFGLNRFMTVRCARSALEAIGSVERRVTSGE